MPNPPARGRVGSVSGREGWLSRSATAPCPLVYLRDTPRGRVGFMKIEASDMYAKPSRSRRVDVSAAGEGWLSRSATRPLRSCTSRLSQREKLGFITIGPVIYAKPSRSREGRTCQRPGRAGEVVRQRALSARVPSRLSRGRVRVYHERIRRRGLQRSPISEKSAYSPKTPCGESISRSKSSGKPTTYGSQFRKSVFSHG